jgi:hypothetical protein
MLKIESSNVIGVKTNFSKLLLESKLPSVFNKKSPAIIQRTLFNSLSERFISKSFDFINTINRKIVFMITDIISKIYI